MLVLQAVAEGEHRPRLPEAVATRFRYLLCIGYINSPNLLANSQRSWRVADHRQIAQLIREEQPSSPFEI
jgi:hypothetical protein